MTPGEDIGPIDAGGSGDTGTAGAEVTGSGVDAGTSDTGSTVAGESEDDVGCGCRTVGAPRDAPLGGRALVLFFALGLIGWLRRSRWAGPADDKR